MWYYKWWKGHWYLNSSYNLRDRTEIIGTGIWAWLKKVNITQEEKFNVNTKCHKTKENSLQNWFKNKQEKGL